MNDTNFWKILQNRDSNLQKTVGSYCRQYLIIVVETAGCDPKLFSLYDHPDDRKTQKTSEGGWCHAELPCNNDWDRCDASVKFFTSFYSYNNISKLLNQLGQQTLLLKTSPFRLFSRGNLFNSFIRRTRRVRFSCCSSFENLSTMFTVVSALFSSLRDPTPTNSYYFIYISSSSSSSGRSNAKISDSEFTISIFGRARSALQHVLNK